MPFMENILSSPFVEKLMDRLGYDKKGVNVSSITGGSVFHQESTGVPQAASYSNLVNNYKYWVYTCIDRIATSISKLPLELFAYKRGSTKLKGIVVKNDLRGLKGRREKDLYLKQNNIEKIRIYDHPFLELINRPNMIDTRYTLWYNIVMRLELAGYCGVYMPMNGLRIPGELWALPLTQTASLRAIPDKQEVIVGFMYQDGSIREKLELDVINYIKYPSPKNPFEGQSALLAQDYPYNIDLYLMQQQSSYLQNHATFGNIFTTDQKLNAAKADELREQLTDQYDGALKSGRAIMTHSGLKLDNRGLAQATKDMMLLETEEFARDKLFAAFNMSAGKLGIVKDVNRATMDGLDRAFINDCIIPKTMLIEESFEINVLPKYDEALTMDFKVPETTDRELNIKEKEIDLKTGYKTINEIRAQDEGLEAVPWGDVPWFPLNMTQPGTQIPQKEVEPKSFHGFKAEIPIQKKALNVDYWTVEQKRKVNDLFVKQVESLKNVFIPVMKNHWKDEEKGILERLSKEGKAVKGHLGGFSKNKIRIWLKDNDARVNRININKEKEAKALSEMSLPAYAVVINEAGNAQLDNLGIEVVFQFDDPAVEKWLGSRLKKFSKEVEGTTFDEIGAILREGFKEGLPLNVMGDQIKEKFASWEKWRAQMISRTETVSSSNFADVEAVKQQELDKVLDKFWLNEVDARDTHVAAGDVYNETGAIGVDKLFNVGADVMDAPGNGSLAEENINCRCNVGFIEKK